VKQIRAFFFLFYSSLAVLTLTAQNGGQLSFSLELERLEKDAASPEKKHDALVSLSRLYRLAGNREKAAQAARDAGSARQDDTILLEACALYISLGEYEKAAPLLRGIRASAPEDSPARKGAVLLEAQLAAFRSGDSPGLEKLASDPGYASGRSGIYYTLWQLLGVRSWKDKLLAEYPQSPEARIASGSALVNLAASPQWLLFSGRESIANPAPAQIAAPLPQSPPVAAPSATAASKAAVLESGTMLQTGLYSREGNARVQAEKLKEKGFESIIKRRNVSGGEYWAVMVPSGGDINKKLMELKNSGFESFPVFE
jgi:cell division septation protein DedD